jgi:hypothetical protein
LSSRKREGTQEQMSIKLDFANWKQGQEIRIIFFCKYSK